MCVLRVAPGLAGLLACLLPSQFHGGLSARLPGLLLLPPLSLCLWLAGWLCWLAGRVRPGGRAGGREEAEPKSLCQPRLGYRGLRGERRRRTPVWRRGLRVFSGRRFSSPLRPF